MSMDIENTASQHTQYAERHGRGLRASREGDGQATRTGEYAGHRKKDTVEISEEGRIAYSSMQEEAMEDTEEQHTEQDYNYTQRYFDHERNVWCHGWNKLYEGMGERALAVESLYKTLNEEMTSEEAFQMARELVPAGLTKDTLSAIDTIYKTLKLSGKMTSVEAYQVARELGQMVFNYSYSEQGMTWSSSEFCNTNSKIRAEEREAGRDLAKYITENYLYDAPPGVASFLMGKIDEYIEYSEIKEKGYVFDTDRCDDNGNRVYERLQPPSQFDLWLNKNGYPWRVGMSPQVYDRFWNEYKEYTDEYYSIRDGYKRSRFEGLRSKFEGVQGVLSWEDRREMNCEKTTMFNEEYKAWYAALDAKLNLVQSLIESAKKITDFSGNEKWNAVMNLLPKAA